MKRLLCVVLLLAGAAPAQAHFVWLLPAEKGREVRMVFSDGLAPDKAEFLKMIAHAKLYARDADGKDTALKHAQAEDVLAASVPGKGPCAVVADCTYGVTARGKAPPFLLVYHARTFVGLGDKAPAEALLKTPDEMPLDVVPVFSTKGLTAVRVLRRGKPLAGAEVALLTPGAKKSATHKTDNNGQVAVAGDKAGLYGVRAGHVEKKAGEHNGKAYKTVRRYATLTLRVGENKEEAAARRAAERFLVADKARPREDPEASKLLTEARGTRAVWNDFPGFTADVVANVDGKPATGKLEVSAKGKATLTLEGPAAEWARATLKSTVAHRMPGGASQETPCAFPDEVTDHPLGRAVRVLNDEFHSSYRIRDRQILVVNRRMGGSRFTITVIENKQNEEKKYLPAVYVVNTWDPKTEALKSSVTHHETWVRVGKFDLPATLLAVRASAGKLEAKSLKLSNHRLVKE
jgi:uncharacterized GH25 family protein